MTKFTIALFTTLLCVSCNRDTGLPLDSTPPVGDSTPTTPTPPNYNPPTGLINPEPSPACGGLGQPCCGEAQYCDQGVCTDGYCTEEFTQYDMSAPEPEDMAQLPQPDTTKVYPPNNCHNDSGRHDAGERWLPGCEDGR